MQICICGFPVGEHARFCESCGVAVRPVPGAATKDRDRPRHDPPESKTTTASPGGSNQRRASAPGEERRQLTVMFCDIKDSTEIAHSLDADTLSDLIRSYHNTCEDVVLRYGGHVAQFLGDGLLVYFGFPHALEDAAERAVRAGLEMFHELDELNLQIQSEYGIQLQSRIGINTGDVLMVEVGIGRERTGQQLGIGEPVNIAARLQSVAEPGSVTLTDRTLALLSPAIETQSLGTRRLKGVAEPIQIYRAIRLDPDAVTQKAEARTLTGREVQLAWLMDRFEIVRTNASRVALIEGEPGVGKSVLLDRFQERLGRTPHIWLHCSCSDYPGEGGLSPVLTLVGDNLGFHQAMTAAERAQRIDRELANRGLIADKTHSVLAPVLGLPSQQSDASQTAPAQNRRERVELLLDWLESLAKDRPVVLVIEDLHLADASMRELVDNHVARASELPILTLITARPGETWSWRDAPGVDTLGLVELNSDDMARVVLEVAGETELPPHIVSTIVERSAGIALFAEELTRAILSMPLDPDSDGAEVLEEIPARLRDLLMSRLDQLGPYKALAQISSVLGPRWSRDLLSAVSGWGQAALVRGLDELVAAGVFKRAPGTDQSSFTYTFRHSLIQEMAYESLSTRSRRELHLSAAIAREAIAPELRELQPQLLAVHYEGAGNPNEAADLWEKAGRRCIEISSHAESVSYLRRALVQLRRIPEVERDIPREIGLEQSLGVSLQVVKGYAAPEAEHAFERARGLCQKLDDPQLAFAAISGLAVKCLVRSELKAARSMAFELCNVSQRSGDHLLQLWSSVSLGSAHFYCGDFKLSLRVLEQGLTHAIGLKLGAVRERYAGDPAIDCRIQASLSLWMLGHREAALEYICEAQRLARQAELPPARGFAGVVEGTLRQLDGDLVRAEQISSEVIELAEVYQLELWGGFAKVVHGWASTLSGSVDSGLKEIESGLADVHGTGSRLGVTMLHAMWADALRHIGRTEKALEIVGDALAARRHTGERYLDAELYRLTGVLILQRDPDRMQEAEAYLRHARRVARRQHACFWEKRASKDLAALWAGRGETERAGRELARNRTPVPPAPTRNRVVARVRRPPHASSTAMSH